MLASLQNPGTPARFFCTSNVTVLVKPTERARKPSNLVYKGVKKGEGPFQNAHPGNDGKARAPSCLREPHDIVASP